MPSDYAIAYAHMVFNTKVCWYLDNTFCSLFHQLFDQGIDATYVVYPICFTIWGLACIFALYQLACIFFTALDSASDASTATALTA